MQRERITDKIMVFRSAQYAQVTAGLVLTSEGAVLIDTMLYPEETLRIRRYVESGLGTNVRYLINTHFHADHTTGACFFPEAQVVSHRLCAEILATRGRESLERMKQDSPEFAPVEVVIPNITFESRMSFELGEFRFSLRSSPGHSPDSIVCLVQGEDVLFAADTVMPIPYFVDGSFDDLEHSLSLLLDQEYENIVQGHGDIILRGEAPEKIASDLEYLRRLWEEVEKAMATELENIEDAIPLAACGKSQVLLNGAVQELHRHNIRALVHGGRSGSRLAANRHASHDYEGNTQWQQKNLI